MSEFYHQNLTFASPLTRYKPGKEWLIVLDENGDWTAEKQLIPVFPLSPDYDDAPYGVAFIPTPQQVPSPSASYTPSASTD